jgi:Glycosyltransferases involved in cell wall biogenesis
MTAPRVSIIIRSMARPGLDTALASLAAQTYPDIEVLVVAASGAEHPPQPETVGAFPLRFIASDKPLSRPEAANLGVQAASGAWFTFLDDDDEFLPEHIAGLIDATARADGAHVVHSLAQAVFADGRRESYGQPAALAELYLRNFIHLSSALISRQLITAGCSFDAALEIHEDWDFLLQCAQHTRFHFEPLQTFLWYVDSGSSGTAGGRNHDPNRFVRFRDIVYDKWRAASEALTARTEPLLQEAANAAQQQHVAQALEKIDEVLAISFNDPWALNMRAMIERMRGDIDAALATQTLATQIRPYDPAFCCNLGQLLLEKGEREQARTMVEHALAAQPDYPPARRLLGQINRASLHDTAV